MVTSALMTCSFGMAPSSFVANPARLVLLSGKTKGNIMDFQPMVNIPPFSMCSAPSNPTVAAATAAAMGVLTPMPCIPVTVAPWAPGNPKVLVQGQPALMKSCQCMCAWGGVIKFTTDGQTLLKQNPPYATANYISYTLYRYTSSSDGSFSENIYP